MIIYSVVRSNRKTTSINVYEKGKVVVRTNHSISNEEIRQFVIRKSRTIYKFIAHKQLLESYKLSENIDKGSVVFYFGKEYSIIKTEIKTPEFNENSLLIPLNYNKARLIKWYKSQAENVILKRATELEKCFNKKSGGFLIFKTRNTFGICLTNNVIKLNCNLLAYDMELIDYVIIHELAHLKYRNHKKLFWNEVCKMDSNYKLHRKTIADEFYKTMFLQ